MNQIKIYDRGECVIDVQHYKDVVLGFTEEICKDQNYMNYMERQRRVPPWRVKQNIADSKYPECAINEFLINERGFPNISTNPDFKVYGKSEKSWAPDLIYDLEVPWEQISSHNRVNIAVKSCTKESAAKYGASYVFNIGTESKPNTIDNAITGAKHSGCDDLFQNGTDQDVVAFAVYDTTNMTCEIRGFANWKFLISDYKNAFGFMKLPKFKTIKVAVYEDYLIKYV